MCATPLSSTTWHAGSISRVSPCSLSSRLTPQWGSRSLERAVDAIQTSAPCIAAGSRCSWKVRSGCLPPWVAFYATDVGFVPKGLEVCSRRDKSHAASGRTGTLCDGPAVAGAAQRLVHGAHIRKRGCEVLLHAAQGDQVGIKTIYLDEERYLFWTELSSNHGSIMLKTQHRPTYRGRC